jgi:hypothetical protein
MLTIQWANEHRRVYPGVRGADAYGVSLNSLRPDTTFSIQQSGGNVNLLYILVPEPSTLPKEVTAALLGLGPESGAGSLRRCPGLLILRRHSQPGS